MKLKYFLDLAYPSFGIKNLKAYSSTPYIIKGFFTAANLSLFIYLAYIGLESSILLKIINSIFALTGFYLLLKSEKITLFWSGFFIGILWFYWIGFSFRYYDMSYAIPLMMLFVAIGYGIIFWVVGIFNHPLPRSIIILILSYIHPMNFNWFIPELTLLDSFFGIYKWQFGLFLLALVIFISIKNNYKYLAIIPLLASINFYGYEKLPLPKQEIYLSSLTTPQEKKWDDSYKDESIAKNLNIIYDAIKRKYDIVVLSESAFALFLNYEPFLYNKLKKLSKEITIVTGALYSDGNDSYNSTYYFVDGNVTVANKVVLVPFGEEIPLPSFISKTINKIFYNGAEDYIKADKVSDINIKGEIFRNAICYEATRDELFINNPKFMIAISNNAWFTPSIEPTLQNLLLRYFSILHKTVIFHSATMGKNDVIY